MPRSESRLEPNEAAMLDGHVVVVHCGVIREARIEKAYGPLWAQDVRVRMDYDTEEWVFERKVTHSYDDAHKPEEWLEVSRTPFCTDEDHKALGTINGW